MENTIEELLGKTLTKIDSGIAEITFHTADGEQYRMFHSQDCCENVSIESIDGDLEDLIGNPLLQAESVSNPEYEEAWRAKESYVDSYTWTFYKLATIKGYVTIRWLGESNGYYSESVDFVKL